MLQITAWTLTILAFFISWMLLRYLRKEHPKTWVQLGSPSLFGSDQPYVNTDLLRFFYRFEFIKLGDFTLSVLGVACIGTSIFAFAVFILCVAIS